MRPYQSEALDAIHTEWKDHPATLLVLPTGTGKTHVFAHAIHNEHMRAMVVAHRKELIYQAQDKINRVTGVQPEIEMASQWASEGGMHGNAECVVSTIQTQVSGLGGDGRMSRFKPNEFGLLVIDEAHHATSSTYKQVIDHYQQNPALKTLGVTATPDRHDEAALGQIFGSVAYCYEIPDAIRDGWLVPVRQQAIEVDGLDLSSVRTTAGDLNGADLAAIMEYERNLHEIAGPIMEIADGRRTLVFCASVSHAERLTDIFNRHVPDAARCTHAKTPKEERAHTLREFSDGRCQILCNCGIYTEGFDEPSIQVVAIARPTKSRSLYAQMVGRGTRALPGIVDVPANLFETRGIPDADYRRAAIEKSGKPSLRVIDFVGNCGRHKLVNTADILGGQYDDEVLIRATKNLRDSGRDEDMLEELEKAAHEIEEDERKRRANEARVRAAKTNYRSVDVNPFDVLDLRPVRERGWDKGRQPSDKQLELLRRMGVDADGMTFTETHQLVGEVLGRRKKGLCTYKQAKVLARYGYDTNVSFEEASGMIDRLARNNWQPLPDFESATVGVPW